MKVVLIAAMSKNRVIGDRGSIPWSLPGDMEHFTKLTWGKTVVMGNRTYDEIGHPLKYRRNIVLTRNSLLTSKDIFYANDLLDVELYTKAMGIKELYVIGGQQVYEAFLPHAHEVELTILDKECQGDAFFPVLPDGEWECVQTKDYSEDGISYKICTMVRK